MPRHSHSHSLKHKAGLLPCFACFVGSHSEEHFSPPQNSEETRLSAPFQWKNPQLLPPFSDSPLPRHIQAMEELGIPFVFDIHTHFFPEPAMRAIWQWFDKVNWGIAYRKKEPERLKALQHNRIGRFTTLNYAHKPGMAKSLNLWVSQNLKYWPNAIPFGTFYPEPGVLEYVQQAVEEFGFKGFKLHCEVSNLDLNLPILAETFSYLEKKQIPLVIHTGTAPVAGDYTGIAFFKPFIQKFPQLIVIIAHMGAREIEAYEALFPEFSNLYFDTTMVFVDFLATGEEMDSFLPILEKWKTRVLFGSDFPNIPYALEHPICNLLESPLTSETKRCILYENGMRMFPEERPDKVL